MYARRRCHHWLPVVIKGLKSGKGTMKLGSGAYSGAYSFQSRFESGAGPVSKLLAAGEITLDARLAGG
jgi:hypothetical protein